MRRSMIRPVQYEEELESEEREPNRDTMEHKSARIEAIQPITEMNESDLKPQHVETSISWLLRIRRLIPVEYR